MSKHTPGPWIVDTDGDVVPEADSRIGICHMMPVDGGPARYQHDEVTRANAKLIAAAPELLEALKQSAEGWANAIELKLLPPQHVLSASILRDAATAAIAKATE